MYELVKLAASGSRTSEWKYGAQGSVSARLSSMNSWRTGNHSPNEASKELWSQNQGRPTMLDTRNWSLKSTHSASHCWKWS